MKYFVPFVFLTLCFSIISLKPNDPDAKAIRAVLDEQVMAWNEGNLEKFMEGYWKSDKLQFIGKNGIQYGWQKTLDNYKKSYPDKKAMGVLQFDILTIEKLAENVYWVVGKWKLEREKDTPAGHFSLLWKKIGGKWRIVADHSS
jgi:ketosteroid isomerase-like protein